MSVAYQVIMDFEAVVAAYTYAPYAVAVDSCSNAMMLALEYHKGTVPEVTIPAVTYPSAANAVVHAGYRISFSHERWQDQGGWYQFSPLPIVDAAKRLTRGMYSDATAEFGEGVMVCLSFHDKKVLPIGRGGMILCADARERDWLKCARFDGRHETTLNTDKLAFPGWNCYMTPEQAARGMVLMQRIGGGGICPADPYQDLSKYEFYTKANR